MTFSAYSLISAEWIPCRFTSGKVQKLGLREVLAYSHDIEEIYDSSPLVATSLLRLMLALLYRCFPAITDTEFDETWKRLWHSPQIPMLEADAYFARWKDRFYLFHDQYPFYQTQGVSVVKQKKGADAADADPDTIFRLHKDTPDAANAALFDHRHLYEADIVIPADEAARLLIASQNYGTSSSQSGRYSFDGKSIFDPGGRQNGLLFKGVVCWLTGRTLKETLLLNWVRYIPKKHDIPCWENMDYTKRMTLSQGRGNAQVPYGWLDIYTWQARMIRLIPIENQGVYSVSQLHYTQGRQADKTMIRDPMKFYLRSVTGEEENVLCMKRDKASWRDVHALLQFKQLKENDTRPRVLMHIAEHLAEGDIAPEDLAPIVLNVSGFVNDKAKLILWRHDRLALPIAYLTDTELTARLSFLLDEAEKVEKALANATKSLCCNFLAPGLHGAIGERIKDAREPNPKDVAKLIECLTPGASYWRMLETDFSKLLFNLTGLNTEKACEDWKDALQERAKQAYAEAIEKLGKTPQVRKAAWLSNPDFRAPSRKPKSGTSTARKVKANVPHS